VGFAQGSLWFLRSARAFASDVLGYVLLFCGGLFSMAESTLHPFEMQLSGLWPLEEWKDLNVLLAVSGGADSVALLRAITALKIQGIGRVYVAHFNHRLRDEAEDDEHFVEALCKRFGLQCEIGHNVIGPPGFSASEGIEEMARRVRYEFLNETAGRLGARFVVTAHTADDQVETILHRIVRGTGIIGLSGMARSRPLGPATLLRPMLGVRRRELVAYLEDLGQPYRDDATNTDRRFTRNRIRHELLPLLAKQFNPNVNDALLRLGRLAGEVQNIVDDLVVNIHDQAVKYVGGAIVDIDSAAVADQSRYLLRELFLMIWRRQSWPMQDMGFTEWDHLAEMLAEINRSLPPVVSKHMFPGAVQAEISDGFVRLSRTE
jgi:tRNA(Ile)-lysidine synthase